jgi:hypothetical protein
MGVGNLALPLLKALPVDNSFTSVTSIKEGVESSIWYYNAKTRALQPKWINKDFSA